MYTSGEHENIHIPTIGFFISNNKHIFSLDYSKFKDAVKRMNKHEYKPYKNETIYISYIMLYKSCVV
ncbi:MAG: hypothetical protein CMP77_09585 [Flavobacterium sp.]|nr:hypothetical protein [Flavobacterium sp.]